MTEFLSRLAWPFKTLTLRQSLWFLSAMFVATGFTGLLAEQSFEKLLSGLLGASTPAAAVVLAVYFLGLTLGATAYVRWCRHLENPIRLYAILELVVAVWSLLLLVGSQGLVILFIPLLKLGAGRFWLLQILRGTVALIWILPPTLAMGATFPAMADSLVNLRIPQPHRSMTRFYSLNLAGAILGAILGPYLIFPSGGLTGALGLTFLLDGFIGALALGLSRFRGGSRKPALEPGSLSASLQPDPSHRLLLGVAFASGFIFFSLEVIWTHLIAAVLGNSVYAFAAMLTMVLVGLGIGGALATFLFKERKPASTLVVATLILCGSLSVAWQYGQWPDVPLQFILWGSNLSTFPEGELLRWIQAGRLLLPSAILFGMVYPALFRLRVFQGESLGRLAAKVGAANSIGCVLGALFTGFVLIPFLGSQGTLMGLGFLSVLTALALALGYSKSRARWVVAGMGLVLCGAWAAQPDWNRLSLTSGGHVYFSPGHVQPWSRLLFFQEDTLGGITTVIQTANPNKPGNPVSRTLLTNGKFQANDAGEVEAQTGFAMVPIVHARQFDRALVIGLGSGHSAEAIHRMGFAQMDIAEIAPGIVEAARAFFPHINGRVLDQPNTHLILEDGRNHLLLTRNSYDLITMELTSVWFSGATSLYSREFYRLAKAHLRPGGILQQWIQIHHIGAEEVGSVLGTMREAFPHVEFWIVGGQGILLGSDAPLELQKAALEKVVLLNPWGDPTPQAAQGHLRTLLTCRLLSAAEVDHLLAREDFPINTDSNRYLEYATPRYNLSREPFERMLVKRFGRFATFPPFPAVAGASPLLGGVLEGTSTLSRRRFGLDETGPVSAAQ
jgi:spermidine synthase